MVDLTAIQGAVSGLQAASNLAKSFVGLRDDALIQGKVIELQTVILSAQSSALVAQSNQSTLLEEARSLREKLAELEVWNTERLRYELKNIGYGAFTYMLKSTARESQPPHWVCVNCYGQQRISIIQYVQPKTGSYEWSCPACKTVLNARGVKPEWFEGPERPAV